MVRKFDIERYERYVANLSTYKVQQFTLLYLIPRLNRFEIDGAIMKFGCSDSKK